MSKNMKTLMAITASFLFLSCSADQSGSGNSSSAATVVADSRDISVTQLHSLLQSGEEIYLLDVRTRPEFEAARLAADDDLIPFDSLVYLKDRLPRDKSTAIYCFCRSGRRSRIAADYLKEIGYKNALNVSGGLIAWRNLGYEVISGY